MCLCVPTFLEPGEGSGGRFLEARRGRAARGCTGRLRGAACRASCASVIAVEETGRRKISPPSSPHARLRSASWFVLWGA